MSDGQAPPGWYADPQDPGRWRWFDGGAWTDQVSAPSPAAAIGWQTADPPRGRTPLWVWLLVGAAGLLVVGGLAVGASFVGRAVQQAASPSGPAFASTAPATLDGMAASSDTRWQKALDGIRSSADNGSKLMGGAGGTQVQAYSSDSRHVAYLSWTPLRKKLSQHSFIDGVRREMVKSQAIGITEYDDEAGGATMLCAGLPRPDGLTASVCTWVRSGTGFVQVVEVGGSGAGALASVTRTAVGALTPAS
ncbi:MAG TPA: DUF2510 domain-containing protein [Candidatus Nanopelagicales bacterium]|nr:DUF2510 domain-containing protein [Candidatus Nanopelagicales bacterium]